MAIRNDRSLRDLPFIIYTATFTRHTDHALGETLGADAYLTKPSPIASVLEALRDAQQAGTARAGRRIDSNTASLYGAALARKIQEKKQLASRNSMLYSISHMLGEARTLDKVAPKIVAAICDTLDWACGACWKWDEASQTFVSVADYTRSETLAIECMDAFGSERFSPATMGRNFEVLKQASAWIALPRDRSAHTSREESGKVQGVLLLPISVRSQTVGLLRFCSLQPDEPDVDLLQCLETIALHIGQFLARISAQDEMYRLAHFDSLTGLPNRGMLRDLATKAIADAQRSQRPVAFLFVDLDGFKQVNDRHGHDAGDRVLATFADRLRGSLRGSDAVAWPVESTAAARLGGDEFAVLISDFGDRRALEAVAKRILTAAATPFNISGADIQMSASIGIAVCPEHGDDLDVLKQVADKAMYRAKQSGKNACCFAPARVNQVSAVPAAGASEVA